MKRGVVAPKYFVMVDCYHDARIYTSIESWVSDYKTSYATKKRGGLDQLIAELKTPPEWAKSFVDEEAQRCEFNGKIELLRALQNQPYKAEAIDVSGFLNIFDPDAEWFEATFYS